MSESENNGGDLSQDSPLSQDQVALYGSIIIGLGRVYDVLLMMYSKMDPEAAVKLRGMHESGRMWYPPPSYTTDDDVER